MTQRKSNFELIRIFAMFFIVGAHLIGHGLFMLDEGYNVWSKGTAINQIVSAMLEMGGSLGVALFFILTGYFCIDKDKISLTKVICETVYYGMFSGLFFVISYLCGYGFVFADMAKKDLILSVMNNIFIPVSGGAWWFVTAYIFLMLLHPVINRAVNKLNQKGFLLLLFVTWLFWYSFGNTMEAAYFGIQKAVFFYLIGGYIRKYVFNSISLHKQYMATAFALSVILYTITEWIVVQLKGEEVGVVNGILAKLINAFEISILIPISAIAFFILLGNMNMKYHKMINKVAATTFGIYLLHDSFVGRHVIWVGFFKISTVCYASKFFPVIVFFVILVIFIACSLLDLFRIRYVEPIMLRVVKDISEIVHKKYVKEECK